MKLTQTLFESATDYFTGYFNHPFVKGIGDGTLDIEKFRFYMIQDYLYLLDYSKVFAQGVVKAKDEKTMRFFASQVNNILNGEMQIHHSYMNRLSITSKDIEDTKPDLVNTSYTNYMLWVGCNEGLLELTISILACAYTYQLIGEELAKIDGSMDHEFYGEWIKGYASPEYKEGNKEILQLVDDLSLLSSKEQIENCKTIFLNCCIYEAAFWDMAFANR